MNNGNSSKQVLLSVLGIAILVVAVVGVSFAFFTYSKTGEKNNVITTGTIFFNFSEGDRILLTDQFPLTDTQGKELSKDYASCKSRAEALEDGKEEALAACNNEVLSFTVSGYDGSGKGIDYDISVVPGTAPTGDGFDGREKMNDNAIKLWLTGASKGDLPSGATSTYNTTPKLVSESASGLTEAGIKIGSGKISGGSKDEPQEDKYELRMWINGEAGGVEIGQTDDSANNKYTSTTFANLYYALKVKVDAKTSTGA